MIIAHLSDIHIRKTRRHTEYKKILENLVGSIESFNVDRIAIAGDLLHNKTDLSPEAVDLASLYLNTLSDVAPVDIILPTAVVLLPSTENCRTPAISTSTNLPDGA